MEPRPRGYAVRAVLALLAIAALVAPVLVLRALPATDLAEHGLAWVPPVLAAAMFAAAAVATTASLVTSLRYGSLESLLLAGSSAALVGGSLARIGGAGTIALSIVVAGGLMLAAAVADRVGTLVPGRGARLAVAGALLIGAWAMVVAEVLPPVMDALAPYHQSLLVAAAVLAGLAAIVVATRDLAPAAVATAVGATALAISRGDGAELAFGLVALAGAGLLIARALIGTQRATNEIDGEPLPGLAMQLSEGVLRFDGHLRLRSWNPAAAALLGLDGGSTGARLEDLLGLTLAQLPAATETVLHRTPVGGLDLSIHRDPNAITVVVHDPGSSTDAERLGRELRRTIEELLQARRTVELQRAELERAASIDPLTGVSSRGAILDRLRIEVAEARRYQHPVAVVLLDVDHFGEINSAHGIAGGDAVLREVALRVRLRVRAADAIGRSGSDGLLAVLPHTDEGGAATFADVLRRRIGQRPVSVGEVEVAATLSVGVAVMRPGEDLDFDGLMARAEEALASARGAGGDRIALDRLHGLARLEEKPPTGRDRLTVADDDDLDDQALDEGA
jgi:diguanylate cyclase (GGDEF)-like protein